MGTGVVDPAEVGVDVGATGMVAEGASVPVAVAVAEGEGTVLVGLTLDIEVGVGEGAVVGLGQPPLSAALSEAVARVAPEPWSESVTVIETVQAVGEITCN